MITQLDLYILNNDNSVAPFPSEAEQIVLYDFAFEAQRMGSAPEITATIQANGSLENSLTTKVFCEYNGERYFLKNLPSSAKENTDPRYTFDLTFVSERTILDNVYMIDAVQGDSNIDRYQSNSTNIVFMGTIAECVARLNAAMTYAGVGYSVVLDEGITTESKLVSFQDKFFTEALQEIVNIHNIPYYYVGKVIHFGWAEKEVPRTLKYAEGLVSISKDISNTRIVTRATATGSSENIPYYYPNPTPLGIIKPNASASNNGITSGNITLVNPYKFSKLQSNKLQYFVSKASASIIHYAVANIPSAEENIIATPYSIQCEIPHEDYKMAGALVHLSAKDYIDRTVYVEFNHSKVSGDAPINEVRPIEYGVYKFTELDGQIVLTEDRTVDVTFESSALGDFVVISNFPADQERYVMATYYNSSSWDVVIELDCDTSLSEDEVKTSWYVVSPLGERGEKVSNISNYGLSISGTPSDGDIISIEVIRKIPFATSLMPPIYREYNGEQRFYNATNGAYEGITFENEYDSANPLEAITKFEDIKPTIVGVTNADGERIDMFSAFAYDLYDDDSTITDSEGNEEYVHPYFYAKLHKTNGRNSGFNLFAQAIESGEMTIEMTSGVCGACKFTIMVDSNTQRNLVMVDDNGNLIYDDATGKVKMADDATGLDRQNDTQNYEVWIALKKDINTFGQIMPNVSYEHYPSISDTFVITNIVLPDSYIENAEKRLESAIIDYIATNNKYKFNYNVNISRIYLKRNVDVYETISENSIIPIEYNGVVKSFYITAFTYKKEKNAVLPDISITLSDSIESSTNSFSQTISAVKIDTQKYVNSQPYISDLSKMFLRKDMQDTASAPITFKKQLVFCESILSDGFKSGSVNGYGLGLYKDANGLYTIEVDRVLARRGMVGDGVGDATPSKDVVTTNTNQTITGVKTFANGFKMSEGEEEPVIRYDVEKKTLIFPMNVLVEGGVAWNSSLDGFDPQTIAQAVKVDWSTIGQKEDGTLYVIGGTGGGSGSGGVVGGVTIDEVKNYLTTEGYATQVWVNEQDFLKSITSAMVTSALNYTPFNTANFTKNNIKNTLGISDWALASVKPSYKFSEITNKPTTLSGYGITDAYTKTQVDSALAKKWTKDDSLIANWNTAFGWGNHATAGYAKQSDVTEELKKYVTLSTAQTVTGIKNFVNGLKIGGALVTYNASNNAFIFPANAIFEGGIAWNSKLDGFSVPSIMDAIQVDGATISKDKGYLEFVGKTSGGGTADSVAWENVVGRPTKLSQFTNDSGFITSASLPTKLSQFTDDVVLGNYLPIKGIAEGAKTLKGLTTSSSWIVAAGNGFNVYNNSSTKRCWFGFSLPEGSPYATTKWVFGASDGSYNAAGEIYAKHISLGYGDSTATGGYALRANGDAKIDGSLTLNGKVISYNASNNAFILPANVIIEGGVAWNSKIDGFDIPTIMDAVIVDGETIVKENGVLKVNGDVSGGINETQLGNYLTRNNYAKKSDIPSLSGYATESFVTTRGYITASAIPTKVSAFTNDASYATESFVTSRGYITSAAISKANIKSILGISDWALATASPLANHGKITSATDLTALTTGLGYTQGYTPVDGTYNYGQLLNFATYRGLTQIYIADGYSSTGRTIHFRNDWNKTGIADRAWHEILSSYTYTKYAMSLTTDQRVTGIKNFVNGFKVGDNLITYDASLKSFVLNGNLIVKGGIAWEKQNS